VKNEAPQSYCLIFCTRLTNQVQSLYGAQMCDRKVGSLSG
jgi:hypothetical protein